VKKLIKKILKEEIPYLYGKPYKKVMKSKSDSDEILQAKLSASDKDLQSALSRLGYGGKIDYYPLSIMKNPFKVSIEIKDVDNVLLKKWKGVKFKTIERGLGKIYNALIVLNPNSYKKIIKGEVESKTYIFKILQIGEIKLKNHYLMFDAKQINKKDGLTGKIVPQINLNDKYRIKYYDKLKKEVVDNELIFKKISLSLYGEKESDKQIVENKFKIDGKIENSSIENIYNTLIKQPTQSILQDPQERESIVRLFESIDGGLNVNIEENESKNKMVILLGKSYSGRNVYLNIPIEVSYEHMINNNFIFYNGELVYGKPNEPFIVNEIKGEITIS
jgi:hypothetical protein